MRTHCGGASKLLPNGKRFGVTVEIGFRDARLCRIFNHYDLLQTRYGPHLASKIALRLAVLRAAKHLGLVPKRRPIGLRPLDGSTRAFTVELNPPRKLRFEAANSKSRGVRLSLEEIRSVEI